MKFNDIQPNVRIYCNNKHEFNRIIEGLQKRPDVWFIVSPINSPTGNWELVNQTSRPPTWETTTKHAKMRYVILRERGNDPAFAHCKRTLPSSLVVQVGGDKTIPDDSLLSYAIEGPEIPPLGLIPRKIHNEDRLDAIDSSISRYLEAGKEIPEEWLLERNYLLDFLKH